jgi:hypothetical protein
VKIGEALAMAANRSLYGRTIHDGPLTVWLYNLEDPARSTERRIHATAKWFKITPEDVGDRLYVDSGREQRCVIAYESPHGATIAAPVVAQIKAEIKRPRHRCPDHRPVRQLARGQRERQPRDRRRGEGLGPDRRRMQLLDQPRPPCPQGQRDGDDGRIRSRRQGADRRRPERHRLQPDDRRRGRLAGVPADQVGFYFRTQNDKANLAPPERRSGSE